MSINRFFLLIILLLVGIFTYFKPIDQPNVSNEDAPKFSLEHFVIYEISKSGIGRFFQGEQGDRYEDRYEVVSAKFSDNSKKLFESIRSDHARYQDDVIYLNGNVHYARADGLEFRSQEGTYDKKASLVKTRGDFIITQHSHRIDGTRLHYNTSADTVSADKIRGTYELKKERK